MITEILQQDVCTLHIILFSASFSFKRFRLKSILYLKLSTAWLHCRFDGDFCTTAQMPLAAEKRPSSEQRQANQSITLPLCPSQTVDFYST